MPVDALDSAGLVVFVADAARGGSGRPVVLVDGRSGSGKTRFAALLAPALDAQLVRLDDLYPGWDGLAEGSRAVADDVLGRNRWTRWDWARDRKAETRPLDPFRPLVVEGVGSLSRRNRALATLGVWLDCPDDVRKQRALERDGEAYARQWDRWAAQEEAFLAREEPQLLADIVIVEDRLGRLTAR